MTVSMSPKKTTWHMYNEDREHIQYLGAWRHYSLTAKKRPKSVDFLMVVDFKKRELLKLSMGWLHHLLRGVIRLPPYFGVLLNPTIPCYVRYLSPQSVYSPRASQSLLTYSSVPFHRIETTVLQYLEELSLGQPTS